MGRSMRDYGPIAPPTESSKALFELQLSFFELILLFDNHSLRGHIEASTGALRNILSWFLLLKYPGSATVLYRQKAEAELHIKQHLLSLSKEIFKYRPSLITPSLDAVDVLDCQFPQNLRSFLTNSQVYHAAGPAHLSQCLAT